MDFRIFVSFKVSERQKELLRKFCEENIDTMYFVSVRIPCSDDMVFSISMFSQKPDVYFGIYSSKERAIIDGSGIEDEAEFETMLDDLATKYAHATTRKPPVVNKELVYAWVEYFNKIQSGDVKPNII